MTALLMVLGVVAAADVAQAGLNLYGAVLLRRQMGLLQVQVLEREQAHAAALARAESDYQSLKRSRDEFHDALHGERERVARLTDALSRYHALYGELEPPA